MSGTVHSLVDHWILPLSVPFTVWCASSLCLSQSTHGILGTQDAHMVWHYPKQLWEIESGYMERVKNCNFPLLCPDLVFLLPLPIPKLTRSGVPTQEILDGTGSTSTFPQFILGLGLWLGSDKLSCGIEGHFPRAGLLPGFQKDQRIRLEVFLFFFFLQGDGFQIGTLCLVSLSCRAWWGTSLPARSGLLEVCWPQISSAQVFFLND
jgi:hypothetical protein